MSPAQRLRRLRAWLLFAAGALITGGWLMGRSAMSLSDQEEVLRVDALTQRITDELERELTDLLAREEARPFLQYRTTWVPFVGSEPVDSPLTDGHYPPGLIGYFQIDPHGTWSTPARTLRGHHIATLREASVDLPGWGLGEEPPPLQIVRTVTVDVPQPVLFPEPVVSTLTVGNSLNLGALPRQDRANQFVQQTAKQVSNFAGSADPPQRDEPSTPRPDPTPSPPEQVTREVTVSVPQTLDPNAVDVDVQPLRSVRVTDDALVLARQVRIGWRTWLQGVVVDKQTLVEHVSNDVLAASDLSDRVTIEWSATPDYRFEEPFDALGVNVYLAGLQTNSLAWRWVWILAAGMGLFALLALVFAERSTRATIRWASQRDQFTQAVTHELKTPIAAMQLYSEMLEQGMVTDGEQRARYHRTLRAEAGRLGRLVDQVLWLSQLDGPSAASGPIDAIGPVVQRAVELLSPVASAGGIDLVVHLHDDIRNAPVREDAVAQIVHNLVDNAVKFHRLDDPNTVTLRIEPHRVGVQLIVADHGPGVPQADRKRIFETFQRLEDESTRTTQGTGLGLALVARLAQRLGGRATAEETPNGGLTVRVTLTLAS